MFRKFDLLVVLGAAMMIAAPDCCVLTNYLPAWAAYLGGMVLHLLRSADSVAKLTPVGATDKTNKNIRAA